MSLWVPSSVFMHVHPLPTIPVAPITIWILLGRTLTLTIVHSRPFFPSVFSAINLLAYGTFLFLLRYRVSALLGAMVHASVAVVFPLYFLTYHTDPGFIPKGEPPPSYGAHISSSEGQRGEGAGGVQPNGCGMADGGSVRGGGGEVAAQQQGKQDLQHGEQELGQGQGQRQGQGQLNEEQWQSWCGAGCRHGAAGSAIGEWTNMDMAMYTSPSLPLCAHGHVVGLTSLSLRFSSRPHTPLSVLTCGGGRGLGTAGSDIAVWTITDAHSHCSLSCLILHSSPHPSPLRASRCGGGRGHAIAGSAIAVWIDTTTTAPL
ncbi:unnamed protein product [Closterium sp. NIES-65]|nr:unnamed protein product [Closterium sp. NIES-65]